MFRRLFAFCVLCCAVPLWLAAQQVADTIAEPDRSADDFVFVSFCIADPTDQSQDYLGIAGHAFLRLQCPYYGLDYCFTYESEKIKGQLWDFLTGRLRMGMYAVPTQEYIEDYRVWQRAVHEYRITMTPEAKQRLWEQMDNHMMHEQRMTMNIIKYGCTNTLRKYVEQAILPDTISYGHLPEKFYTMSALDIAMEHWAAYPWTALGMRLYAGRTLRQITRPINKVLMPTDLLEVWQQATFQGEPLLTYVGDLVQAEPVQAERPWFTPAVCGAMLLAILVVIIIIVVLRRRGKR